MGRQCPAYVIGPGGIEHSPAYLVPGVEERDRTMLGYETVDPVTGKVPENVKVKKLPDKTLTNAVSDGIVPIDLVAVNLYPFERTAAEPGKSFPQVVEMIDHAVARHAGKVKFLSFREVEERIDKNLLGRQPLRAANGQDNGVRVLDVADAALGAIQIQRRETAVLRERHRDNS